eukprot:m.266197 g.266197  ORF g.266197 m.266197 type:complete len:64 (-) comp11065_c0_seq22:2586-2777(-)
MALCRTVVLAYADDDFAHAATANSDARRSFKHLTPDFVQGLQMPQELRAQAPAPSKGSDPSLS